MAGFKEVPKKCTPFCTPFLYCSSITEPCIERLLIVGQIDAMTNGFGKKWDASRTSRWVLCGRTLLGLLLQIRLH
jgi:hypothetical protein